MLLGQSQVQWLLPGAVRHSVPKRGLLRAACADQLGAEAPEGKGIAAPDVSTGEHFQWPSMATLAPICYDLSGCS